MTPAPASQPQFLQTDADAMTRVGGWLFKRRTFIPLPLAAAVLLLPARTAPSVAQIALGASVVALGEAIRLWGVRHIGAISRTRSDRLGPLVASGPFGLIRNPLYVGNIALWVGFAFAAGLVWLAPLFVIVLAFEYHAIVQWEERLLRERLGDRYRAYAARVPRWIPWTNLVNASERTVASPNPIASDLFTWRETLYSERGTLIAIAIGFALLWLKA
jgi:protein-S-isoprenylcysteine O-methyltransferase Ste14